MDKSLNLTQIQVCYFLIENIKMCISLESIYKILPLPQLEIIPGCPNYMAGLLNLSGQIIPIFDLAIKLALPRKNSYTVDTPIIICSDNLSKSKVGLIVDKIIGIQLLDQSILQMQNKLNKPDSPFMAVTGEEKSALLVNIDYILKLDLSLIPMSKIKNKLLEITERHE